MNGMAISTPELAHHHLLEIWPEPLDFREIVMVLYLDRNHYIIGSDVPFKGGLCECVIDTYVLFSNTLKVGARAILVAHNHPSGNVAPSKNDILNSELIQKAAEVLRIDAAQMIISRSDFHVVSFF